jgi:hypothetical protein
MPEVCPELPEDDEMRQEGRVNAQGTGIEALNRRAPSASDFNALLPLLVRFDPPTYSAFP